MSAPSGIKVPTSLSAAFSSATTNADDIRALVFIIEGESFSHLVTIKPHGSYTDDIALLPGALPTSKTPASFAYRLDSQVAGKYEWMMVTFVPDDAGVRAKMLQASSRAGLLKALGANNFKHDWFATSLKDLTPTSLKAHLEHILSPPPLTASEAALAEIKAAEQEEAKRVALDGETAAARRRAVVGLGGKTQWEAGVDVALRKAAERSDVGWLVTLEISAANSAAITLLRSEECTPAELSSKLPAKSPCYAFYSYPTPPPPTLAANPIPDYRNTFQASEGGVRLMPTKWAPKTDAVDSYEPDGDVNDQKTPETVEPEAYSNAAEAAVAEPSLDVATPVKGRVLFIYWCPSGSPVRYRMVYSTTVRGIQQDAADKAGVEIVAKLETSDISDLTEKHLRDEIPSRPTHTTSLPTPSRAPMVFGAPAPSHILAAPVTARVFGAPAPAGATFGRPMPVRTPSQIPLPASNPATPISATPGDQDDDSKDSIRRAFDAFGPRVNAGGAGGFSRPRPAGRR